MKNPSLPLAPKQTKRFYEAEPVKEMEALTKKYLQMLGCRDCLDFKKYSCEKNESSCTQPEKDRQLLNDLRTIILDLDDIVHSQTQVREELVFPGSAS